MFVLPGSKLMQEAISRCKTMNVNALFLFGAPEYYKRFNFVRTSLVCDLEYHGPYFQQLDLKKGCLDGLSPCKIIGM